MSYFRKLSASLCFSLLYISLAQADSGSTIKLSEPGEICFPRTSLHADFDKLLHAELNKSINVMLDHNLIIPKEDHFKKGLVFVGFRLKSQPDALWLLDGENWTKHNNFNSRPFTEPPKPFSRFVPFATQPEERLQPLMPTNISRYPVDVSAYIGDGEIWIGYGLSSETEASQESSDIPAVKTSQDIFDEMIDSGRFKAIWNVGDLLDTFSTICLSITELTETVHMVTTQ